MLSKQGKQLVCEVEKTNVFLKNDLFDILQEIDNESRVTPSCGNGNLVGQRVQWKRHQKTTLW